MAYHEVNDYPPGAPDSPISPITPAPRPFLGGILGALRDVFSPRGVKIAGIPEPIAPPDPDRRLWSQKIKIPWGEFGTTATLRRMGDLAVEAVTDPYFLARARAIVRGIPSKAYEAEADKILQFAKEMVDYREDPLAPGLVNYVLSPGFCWFVEGQGNCATLSTLIAAIDLADGKPVKLRAVKCDPNYPTQYSHVYPLVLIHGKWLAQDAVPEEAQLGWEPPVEEWLGPANDLEIVVP